MWIVSHQLFSPSAPDLAAMFVTMRAMDKTEMMSTFLASDEQFTQ